MNQVTTNDILQAVRAASASFDSQLAELRGEINEVRGEINGIKGETTGLKDIIADMKSVMVTKDYLDEKLNDLRSDMGISLRKGDAKVDVLIEVLHSRKVISNNDRDRLLSLSPFAK